MSGGGGGGGESMPMLEEARPRLICQLSFPSICLAPARLPN